ncbi:conserved hypothetical protein [Ricinus communis]|uniref:Secreted protein n=1 Tax=Ricinus communis TaxID=3988 RepID=B9S1E3_RICCO|nr:conserved hypothetical protein [Ricinus communis]
MRFSAFVSLLLKIASLCGNVPRSSRIPKIERGNQKCNCCRKALNKFECVIDKKTEKAREEPPAAAEESK